MVGRKFFSNSFEIVGRQAEITPHGHRDCSAYTGTHLFRSAKAALGDCGHRYVHRDDIISLFEPTPLHAGEVPIPVPTKEYEGIRPDISVLPNVLKRIEEFEGQQISIEFRHNKIERTESREVERGNLRSAINFGFCPAFAPHNDPEVDQFRVPFEVASH